MHASSVCSLIHLGGRKQQAIDFILKREIDVCMHWFLIFFSAFVFLSSYKIIFTDKNMVCSEIIYAMYTLRKP